MTKSTKSPLHANRDSGVDGWTGGEDKEIQRDTKHGTLDFDLRNNKEDGAE